MIRCFLCFALVLFAAAAYSQIAVFQARGNNNTLSIVSPPDGRYSDTLFGEQPAVMNFSFADNLYFAVDPGIRQGLGNELWLAIYGGSDVLAGMRLRYNSLSEPYRYAPGQRLLGQGRKEALLFHVTDADFKGSQNGGADFRLETYRFRLTRAELYTQKPDISVLLPEERAGEVQKAIDNLPQLSVSEKNPMEFVVCGDDGFGRPARESRQSDPAFGTSFDDESVKILKKLGVTSVQCYLPFESVMPDEKGVWKWEPWDKELKVLEENNMGFSPFLILGPSYAMPEWYRQSDDFQPGVCLEHGKANMVDNIWNKNTVKYVDMFLRECGGHLSHKGLQTVLLGIQGDYGEAIQPVMGGLAGIEPGDYHGHPGFWCDTPEALEDFRSWARKKYRFIRLLNRAWGKDYRTFGMVEFPAKGEAMERLAADISNASPKAKREYLDFVTWYRGSMNRYAAMWMETAQKYFDVPVYLCTGGGGEPAHGSDFSLNAKMCAGYKSGIRITNEGSVYIHNNLATRLLTSAARFYGARMGKEPFGNVSPEGVVARIYGSIASGCTQHEDYYRNLTDHPDKYRCLEEYAGLLEHHQNIVSPAVLYYPNIACTLGQAPWWPDYENIRYIANVEYCDENMLRDGALEDRLIMVMPATVVEPGDAGIIMEWVKKGGILIVMDKEPMTDVEGTGLSEKILFPKGPDGCSYGRGRVIRTDDFNEIAGIMDREMQKHGYATYSSPKHDFLGADLGDMLLFYNPGAEEVRAVYNIKGIRREAAVPAYGIKAVDLKSIEKNGR